MGSASKSPETPTVPSNWVLQAATRQKKGKSSFNALTGASGALGRGNTTAPPYRLRVQRPGKSLHSQLFSQRCAAGDEKSHSAFRLGVFSPDLLPMPCCGGLMGPPEVTD